MRGEEMKLDRVHLALPAIAFALSVVALFVWLFSQP